MQSNTLQKVEIYLKSHKILKNDSIMLFVNLLSIYKLNSFIYPQYFIDNSGITENECYKVLSHLANLGILKLNYKIYCSHCHHVTDEIFETLNDVEDYWNCESCSDLISNEGNPFKYLIIIYKVMME